jgi:hypothetical protein
VAGAARFVLPRARRSARDGFWAWTGQRLPEDALLALYRGAVFYGVCRFAAWVLRGHVWNHYGFDFTWGGPHWVQAGHLP